MKKIIFKGIEEYYRELSNFSKNNIASKIEELSKLPDKITWVGIAHDSYIQGYNKQIDDVRALNDNIHKLAEFLLIVNERYGNANLTVNNDFEELLGEVRRVGE